MEYQDNLPNVLDVDKSHTYTYLYTGRQAALVSTGPCLLLCKELLKIGERK
jgi:hypothetical protein